MEWVQQQESNKLSENPWIHSNWTYSFTCCWWWLHRWRNRFSKIIREAEILKKANSMFLIQCIDLYFIWKLMISKMTKQFRIYSIGNVKRSIIKAAESEDTNKSHKQGFMEEIKNTIKDYWDSQANHYFTINDIKTYIETKFEKKGIISCSTIRRFIKSELKLRYKRISPRPPIVITPDVVSKQKNFWKFYWKWKNNGIKIIQIDEFSVGRSTFPSMAWSKSGESGYVIQDPITSKFSVISAIWDSNLELVAISRSNTNREVFLSFMKLLSKEIDDRYRELKNRVVVTMDGARYHWVNEVKEFCESSELMIVQTPPYTPQFSHVEIFINCTKGKIKRRLRKNR